MINNQYKICKLSLYGSSFDKNILNFLHFLEPYSFYQKNIFWDEKNDIFKIHFFDNNKNILNEQKQSIRKRHHLNDSFLEKNTILTIRNIKSCEIVCHEEDIQFDKVPIYIGYEGGLFIKDNHRIIIEGTVSNYPNYTIYLYSDIINIFFEEYFEVK